MAAGIALVLAVTALASPFSDAEPRVWTFSEEPVGEPPRGWEILSGTWEDDPVPGRVGLKAGPRTGVLLDDFEIEPASGGGVPG
jgi:hypothetical protein